MRRQCFLTRAEVWAKNWANFSAHFRASFAVQNDSHIFSPNSSQFITPCLVAEIFKFLLRGLLGFGGRKGRFVYTTGAEAENSAVKFKRMTTTIV